MALLARGAITDRPWGQTLGALGARGLTGELTVVADGKPYRIAFTDGAVVGAASPLANDSAIRIALTTGLISTGQVNDITRRLAAAPNRDEVEVLAEAARLAPDHALRLRRRLVAQRAARTFSIDTGDFVIDDHITVPVVAGAELDVRAVIFLGAKSNLTETRLADELNQFGAWFRLVEHAVADLPYFGFSDVEKPVLKLLMKGLNLEELERASPEVGERGVRALVYALATVGACEIEVVPRPIEGRITRDSIPPPRASTTGHPAMRRPITNPGVPSQIGAKGTGATEQRMPRASTSPATARTQTPTSTPARGLTPDGRPASLTSSRELLPDGRPASPTPGRGLVPDGRAPSPNDPAAGRAPTPGRAISPSNPPVGRTPSPSQTTFGARAASPTTPAIGRTPSGPTGHPALDRPQMIDPPRTQTPTVPPRNQPATRAPSGSYPQVGRAPTPSTPITGRVPTPTVSPMSRTSTDPVISRTISAGRAKPPTPSDAQPPRPPTGPHPVIAQRNGGTGPIRNRRNTAATKETEGLIAERVALLDRSADHYQLLGISQDASPDVIRAAYFTLARKLHPDRLASLGIDDGNRDAQRLFAQINTAFSVLNDAVKRTEYQSILRRGGESAVRAEEAKADELAMRVMHAEEAFRRGEMALRREQLDQAVVEFTTAIELQPQEAEYLALFAWAKFAASKDKPKAAGETRRTLLRAADMMTNSPTARFYLGRVERILGREREALEHFHEVLRMKPNHSEASSEVRILEQRLKKR